MMRFLVSSLLLLPCTAQQQSFRGTTAAVMEEAFEAWRMNVGKEYANEKERLQRRQIWHDNHVTIETHNNKESSFQLGHNEFSDLTAEEYQSRFRLGSFAPPPLHFPSRSANDVVSTERRLEDLPDTVDWVAQGAIVGVKNQLMCGSCWAFSAVGAIEGAHYLDTGNLTSLSEQQLVDCDHLDFGCNGGLMDNAFLFDENSTGICSEDEYPYVGHKRWIRGCKSEKGLCTGVPHTRVKSFVDVANNDLALQTALAKQPVAVAIQADLQSFQFYKSGVYDDIKCGNELDHGVLAVGYGTDVNGTDYWKVRNSWGATWGDEGYFLLARGKEGFVNGTCGILQWPSRPLLRNDDDDA